MASWRKRAAATPLVLVAIALAGCAGSRWQTESAAAPGADLAGYATFGWQPPSADRGDAAPLSIAEANLRSAMRKQLVARGYRETEVEPDLRIGFETETRLVERTAPSPRVGIGVGTWGGSVGTSVGTSVPVGGDRITSAAATRVTIRAVDPRGPREVWFGTASGELEPGLETSAVDELVSRLMEDFPPRRR
jgi:hypothetical protein